MVPGTSLAFSSLYLLGWLSRLVPGLCEMSDFVFALS